MHTLTHISTASWAPLSSVMCEIHSRFYNMPHLLYLSGALSLSNSFSLKIDRRHEFKLKHESPMESPSPTAPCRVVAYGTKWSHYLHKSTLPCISEITCEHFVNFVCSCKRKRSIGIVIVIRLRFYYPCTKTNRALVTSRNRNPGIIKILWTLVISGLCIMPIMVY